MCGICGIVNFQKDTPPSIEALNGMSRALAHRGPDDEGLYLGRRAGLAVKRLSIIDLVTGHQPIHNEDKSISLVLNGEIYNYKELQRELQDLGHRFYTNSDTEVIAHGYEEYGEECVARLRGMFAFALWDEKKETLILARDRLGIKPLYYSILKDRLLFASDTKTLFQSGAVGPELNLKGIDQFFTFSYVPGPQTIFRKIKKLPPAHILIWRPRETQIRKYWQLDYSRRLRLSEEEYQDRLSGLLDEAIELHLRSDVPVGIFLSGGIDSSTITYLVNQRETAPIKTFSIGFDDERFNELGYARIIAGRFKTEHHEGMITDRALESLPEIIERLSEPLADISIIPTYFISKMAASKVKVILSGEGGDEMFAGYPWYKVSRLGALYQQLPMRLRRYVADMIRRGGIKAIEKKSHLYKRLRTFLLYSALPFSGRYLWRVNYFAQEQKERLFSKEFREDLKKDAPKEDNYPFGKEQKFEDFLSAMLYFDTKFFLPDDLLAKMDQMTMAHSLEGRVPFLDHKLVEFASSLPSEMKLHKGKSKYILRKFISSKLPREILTKPKQGLMPPTRKWVDKRLDDFFMPILNDQKTQRKGYFDQAFIKQMIKDHREGRIDYSYQIWTLTLFELWSARWAD